MIREVMITAKQSKLSKIHPLEKSVFVVGALIMSSYMKNPNFILINIILFLALHLISKNPIKMVIKFVIAIAIFYIFSAVALFFSGNMNEIVLLLARTLFGGLAISFLTLTTPLDDILRELSKHSFIRDLCDIAKAMERFIILIEDEVIMLSNSFKARGAFSGFKKSVKDFAKLVAILLKNTLIRWKYIREGLNSRGYRGVTSYITKDYKHNIGFIVGVIMYFVLNLYVISII